MSTKLEAYKRRQVERELQRRRKAAQGWLGWWRNPGDRFAGLVAIFTAALFAATVGLWIATKELVEDARSSGRAWVGPTNATMVHPISGQPLKVTIFYGNTGRQPAATNFVHNEKIYTSEQWNDGTAAAQIIANKESCASLKMMVPIGHVTYPTTSLGSGFSALFDSSDTGSVANNFLASDKLVGGDEVFVFQGCMVYETNNDVHHSAFCYFYKSPTADQQLRYCTVGQAAD